MGKTSVTDNSVRIARASFDRCCEAPGFLDAFYVIFFAACPAAAPMFARTDFARQHRLLRHAIGLLFSFNQEQVSEPNILTRVAERHGRGALDIDPSWYATFLESLILTVSQSDPQFTPEIGLAWREAAARGVAYMRSKSGE